MGRVIRTPPEVKELVRQLASEGMIPARINRELEARGHRPLALNGIYSMREFIQGKAEYVPPAPVVKPTDYVLFDGDKIPVTTRQVPHITFSNLDAKFHRVSLRRTSIDDDNL